MKISKVVQPTTIVMNTGAVRDQKSQYRWWTAQSKKQRGIQALSTVAALKDFQMARSRAAGIYARLYGNMSLYNFAGASAAKMDQTSGLPQDRPTFNVIQSAADTLVSRITQSRPAPVFLTDNSDYRERNLAKKLNSFILGEFHRCETYRLTGIMLRDALVEGTGCIKVFETADHKVGMERVLLTELFTDPNECIYGSPRQIHQIKLVDRDVLKECFPESKSDLTDAEGAYPDSSADASKTVSDQVMVVESWHLPSGKGAGDGRHVIACSAGTLLDEEWKKDKFPFVFLHYSPRLVGFWAQGLAEQLMGTQLEINSLLYTISKAIKLVGVPRVFQEVGSKVLKASHNNDVGAIIEYRGTKPTYEVAPCVPQELYAQLQRLITYAYQQCGVSALEASAQKPAGLNSGEAIRTYDDISTDRFAALSKRYDDVFVDLSYLVVDLATDICDEQGSYTTVYPNKNGVREIELPEIDLLKNPYVIQCFNMSSLPRDPAGRMQKVTEMIQSGMITIKEGRRLLDYPDLGQMEMLANASEERIFQYLDAIVEDGDYKGPDPFMDLALAKELAVQYYNLYSPAKLEEDRAEMLRSFYTQTLGLIAAATPPPMPMQPTPQAAPQQPPVSPLVPNAVGGAPAGAVA
jgi:hypothetical protein